MTYPSDLLIMGTLIFLSACVTIVVGAILDLVAQIVGLEPPWRSTSRRQGRQEAAHAVEQAVQPYGPTPAGAAALAALASLDDEKT